MRVNDVQYHDRISLLSNLLKKCTTVHEFEHRFIQIQDTYLSLPKRPRVYPKLVIVTPWCVFLKEYCRNNTNDEKSIRTLSKEASIKWKCNDSKNTYYVEKAIQENDNNLEIWKRFYANTDINVDKIMNTLKSEKHIKTLKKNELVHLIGCIGKANEYTQDDVYVKNMRKDLCVYLRSHAHENLNVD